MTKYDVTPPNSTYVTERERHLLQTNREVMDLLAKQQKEIERLEAEKTKLWQMRVAAENACDDLRVDNEDLRATLDRIAVGDDFQEMARRALEPKPNAT